MSRSYSDIAEELIHNEGLDGEFYGGNDSDMDEVFGTNEDPSIKGFLDDVMVEVGGFEDTNLTGAREPESEAESDNEKSPFVVLGKEEDDMDEEDMDEEESVKGSFVIPENEPVKVSGVELNPEDVAESVTKSFRTSSYSSFPDASITGRISSSDVVSFRDSKDFNNEILGGGAEVSVGGSKEEESEEVSEFVTDKGPIGEFSAGISRMIENIYM